MGGYHPPQNNGELIDIVANRRSYLGLHGFDARVLDAMRLIDRAAFAPPNTKAYLYEDEPFQIGHSQTCSQPSMVAAMATMLELRDGLRVLEVGAGCGYSAAVAAQIIAPRGRLITIEFVPELTEFAKNNIAALEQVPRIVEFITGDGSAGLPGRGPFDRIYFTAGAGAGFDEKPLLDQLTDDGILLYPEAYGSMFLVRKTASGVNRREMSGVGFVHLKGKNSGFR